jgi:hypothetical protein
MQNEPFWTTGQSECMNSYIITLQFQWMLSEFHDIWYWDSLDLRAINTNKKLIFKYILLPFELKDG